MANEKITEKLIARVENALNVGAPVEAIVEMLEREGVTGYDAWLVYQAAEVSLKMSDRTYVEVV